MKRLYIFVSLLAVLFGLASCELNKELFGFGPDDVRTGALEVKVAVKQPNVTRGADGIDTSLYPIAIKGTDTLIEYAALADMPASIRLSVGDYTVSSHTPGTLQKKMDSPWYAGSSAMAITKDITTTTTVTCKMKNSRIKLNYGEDFLSNFLTWTITVDDGSSTALLYTESDKSPAAIYWSFEENTVKSITVNVRAKTSAGNSVSDTRTFKKSNATEQYDDVTDYFAGGDAIEINMGVVAASTGTVTGITIKTNISFENNDEYVEIPVEGEDPTTPTDPDATAPTIVLPADFSYSASNASSRPASADAILKTPKGLKSAKVVISTTSTSFSETLADVDMGGNLLNGVELVGNTKIDELFESVGLSDRSPVAGVTTYTFPVGAFFTFLDMFTGTHQFHITVTDNDGTSASGILTITVTE